MEKKAKFTEKKFILTLILVTSLFMFWGIAVSLADVLNRHFQSVLHVSQSQSGLVQFSIFGAYFIMGISTGRCVLSNYRTTHQISPINRYFIC